MSRSPRLPVVFVDHCARLSGGQLALVRLLPGLSERVDARVILAEEGPLAASLEEAGATVEVLPMAEGARGFRGQQVGRGRSSVSAAAASAAYAARLILRLRRLQPALVHTNSLKAAVYGGIAARAVAIPLVWHLRDRIAPDFLPAPAIRLMRGTARVLPDAVLGNEATLPTLGRSRGRTFLVVDPVDRRCFDVIPHGGGDRPLRVGMAGRIDWWKGQDVFLTAFARAFPREDTKAVIIGAPMFGEQRYEEELRALAGRLGIASRVEFRGFRSDIGAELGRLDMAVHASVIPEPFGQVVTEAMAAGLPTVAADAGGPPRIITDGVDGLLTPPGDATALSAALQRLASDPGLRARLGAAARRRARDFSIEAAADAVLAAYGAVLANGRMRRRRGPLRPCLDHPFTTAAATSPVEECRRPRRSGPPPR